jgi:DNA-directed RNA polymerase specialized sigma24 family protein
VADSLPRVSIDDRHVISPACSTDPLGPPVADTTALVAHRDVVAAVEGTLRKRGRTNRQLEDDVLEVQVRAIKAARKGSMPKDVGEWKAFTTTIACRFVIDAQARERTRFKHETELSEETEAYASPILPWEGRDLVDTKRFLGVLKELVDSGQMPEMGGEILWGVAEGLTRPEIAEETRLTLDQVKYRLKRIRRAFAGRLAELGIHELVVVDEDESEDG